MKIDLTKIYNMVTVNGQLPMTIERFIAAQSMVKVAEKEKQREVWRDAKKKKAAKKK